MFKIDVPRFVALMLPPILRRGVLLALVTAIATAIAYVLRRLNTFRGDVLGDMATSGAVISLQDRLNRDLECSPQRIFIASTPVRVKPTIPNKPKAVFLRKLNEQGKPFYLYLKGENTYTPCFIVKVPADMNTAIIVGRIGQIVDKYKPAGVSYRIEFYN